MDTKECIITIDLGTSAVNIFAVDMKGRSIGSLKGSYPTFHVEPDSSEQDPEQIFITTLYVLKNFINDKIQSQHYRVAALCFSAAMHSVLPVDKQGVPLGNAITWMDNRGKKIAQELKASRQGKKIYGSTGTPIHPMSPLIKIAWMKDHDSERFRRTHRFLSIKSYIIQQLTGDIVIDQSMASATGMFAIQRLKWDSDALEFAGISADKLPEPVTVFYETKKLRREYQHSLGLSADVKIIIGASDGCLATLGAGIWGEGKATVNVEQSGAVRVAGNQLLKDEQQRFFNYLLTDNYYISGGPSNNGGVVFEWFANQFGNFRKPFDLEDSMDNLMADATKAPPGSGGLIFLPYLLGERAPIWNPNARGAYFGLNIKHEQQHIVRATVEGILYEIYSIGKTLEEHRSINTLVVNGSFASIPFCTQMIADIFNKPVSMSQDSNSISVGAYLLSATQMGIFKNLNEAAKAIVMPETHFPNRHNHNVYMQHFSIFEKLSMKLSEEFEDIAGLQ